MPSTIGISFGRWYANQVLLQPIGTKMTSFPVCCSVVPTISCKNACPSVLIANMSGHCIWQQHPQKLRCNYQSQKGTPFQFSHAVLVQPTFHQVRTSGCSNTSNDFPSNSLPRPNFPNEHYRVLTINSGSRGQKCDQLSWNVLLGVPAAPTTSCVFILHNAGVDPTHSGTLRFFDVTKNPIQNGNGILGRKSGTFISDQILGITLVKADLSSLNPGDKVDVGALFVDCNSRDFKNPQKRGFAKNLFVNPQFQTNKSLSGCKDTLDPGSKPDPLGGSFWTLSIGKAPTGSCHDSVFWDLSNKGTVGKTCTFFFNPPTDGQNDPNVQFHLGFVDSNKDPHTIVDVSAGNNLNQQEQDVTRVELDLTNLASGSQDPISWQISHISFKNCK